MRKLAAIILSINLCVISLQFGAPEVTSQSNGNPELSRLSNPTSALYSTDENLNFISIDPATGQVTTIGPIGYSIEGLSFAPDKTLYATSDIEIPYLHGGAETLITIDTSTGAGTIIGPMGYNDVDAMAFAPDGTLYGADFSSGNLITINPSTGQGTDVGPLRYPGTSTKLFIGGMVYSSDGILYGSEVPNALGPTNLVTIDTSTAMVNLVGPMGFETVEGIAFTDDGTLYGVTATVGGYPWYQTVDLIVIDRNSGAATKAHTLPIEDIDGLASIHFEENHPPVADAGPDQVVNEGDVVEFDGSASQDPDGIIEFFEWDFDIDDGLWWETSAAPDATGPMPTHVYGDNGVYTVILRVTDDASDTDTDECIVTVNNIAPTITLMMTYPDDEGSLVTFEAESTDPGSDDVTYSWELEYGPTIENTFYNNGVIPEPVFDPAINEMKSPSGTYPFHSSDVATHIYGDNFDYTITLTVTDDDGGESIYTATVTVDNLAPYILEMNIPSQVDEGSLAIFEVLASDQGSDDFTFTWDFELGSTITNVHYNNGVGPDPHPSPWGAYPFEAWDTVNHAYGDDGVYTLSLSIEDDDGVITTFSTDINVQNVAPTIDLVTASGGEEGSAITFSSTGTDQGSDDLTFTWDWGDGTLDTINVHYNNGLGPDPPGSPLGNYPFTTTDTVSHIYGDDGDYTVTLTVEDDDGGKATYTTTVIIDNVAPTIKPFGPFTVDEGSSLELTTTSTDPGSDDLIFTWEFEMGPTITNVYYNDGLGPDPYPSPWGTFPNSASDSVEHTYGDNGVYPVTLTVTDDDGGMTSFTTNITVNNIAPTAEIISVTMDVEIGLRVAGRKFNNVSMELYEDGNLIDTVSIERMPGSPNVQMAWIPININFSSSYTAIVTYIPEDPPNIGANPVWIYIKSQDGSIKKIHHTFNVQQSMKRDSEHWNHVEPWEVDLSGNLTGCIFRVTIYVSDPGSDDETLTYTYGNQTVTKIYLNNPPNPDSFPSPEINPRDITDTTDLRYEGLGTINVNVEDDDGLTTDGHINI